MVLRQGGLRDDLHALAASAGVAGWFDPPVCLFAELASRWNDGEQGLLSAQDRAALLSGLVARHGRGLFGEHSERWTSAVDRFIGDLIGEGVAPSSLSDALSARTGRDAFEAQRDSVLATVYEAWIAELARLGRTDGRDARVRLAAAITADPAAFAERLGGRRDIRIVGLADLRGGWTHLLGALAASPAVDTVTVFASHALEFPESLQVEIEIDTDAPERRPARQLFIEAPDSAREIEIVATRVRTLVDRGVPPHRIAVVARQARPLVDQLSDVLETLGVPVTARRRVALSHTGPARALRALLSAPIEGWSRHAVVDMAEHPLLSLGLDATVLDFVGMESPLASCDEWTAAIERLRDRAVARERASNARDGDRARSLPASTLATATLAAWHGFADSARWLDGNHTPAEWLSWTHGVLTGSAWGIDARLADAPAGDERVHRTDCRAQARMTTLVLDWMRALEEFGVPADSPVDAERFLGLLTVALDEDLILQPETGFGVVVAEALAAGWRSFDHLFVVGLSSGEFPRRMPASALLSDGDRDAMIAAGLPLDPKSAWRSRERELFRVLCAAPTESLVLSWPAMDAAGHEAARSAFVEERIEQAARDAVMLVGEMPDAALQRVGVMQCVAAHETITSGFPIVSRVRTAESIAHAERVATIERERLRALSLWNGEIADPALLADLERRFGPTYLWSATSIEELAKCPYSWMAKRLLRLDERGEADDTIEPLVTGRILHGALERFFDSERERRGGIPVYLTAADRTTVPVSVATSLDAAWTHEETQSWLGAPAMRTFVKNGLLQQLNAYIEFEIAYNEKCETKNTTSSKSVQTGAIGGELHFNGVTITTSNSSFLLRGSIDRFDQSCDTRITDGKTYLAVIDYKSSRYSTPAAGNAKGWDDGVVLQVPLYAQVVSQLQQAGEIPPGELARIEYRTLRAPASVHQLQFKGVKGEGKPGKKTFSVVDDESASVKFEEALTAAGQRVEQARRGEFPASPAPSCGCSPYCPARDVCRVPGGPAVAGQFGDAE